MVTHIINKGKGVIGRAIRAIGSEEGAGGTAFLSGASSKPIDKVGGVFGRKGAKRGILQVEGYYTRLVSAADFHLEVVDVTKCEACTG